MKLPCLHVANVSEQRCLHSLVASDDVWLLLYENITALFFSKIKTVCVLLDFLVYFITVLD